MPYKLPKEKEKAKEIEDLYKKIEVLINELIKNDSSTRDKKRSLSASIKRLYDRLKQVLLSEGKDFDVHALENYTKTIIEHYEQVKDYKSINMFLQQVAEDYKEYGSDLDIEDIEGKVFKIYKLILGNPGTSIDGMSNEFIADIIRLKLNEEDGINRDDVLNLMMMQYKNMYDNIEEYQRLINSCVIDSFTYSRNGEKFKNPKILHIIERLASSYKVSEQFDKVQEIYKLAEGMSHLKGTR